MIIWKCIFHQKLICIKGTFDDFYKVVVHWSFNIPFVTWALITVHAGACFINHPQCLWYCRSDLQSQVCPLNQQWFFFQAGILMGEINLIWPEIRRQIDDPFLVSCSETCNTTVIVIFFSLKCHVRDTDEYMHYFLHI